MKIVKKILTIIFSLLILLWLLYPTPQPYPTYEYCPDDPEGYIDSNGKYRLYPYYEERFYFLNPDSK